MLSKLLKYEFRATGRIMLPVYALLLVTAGGTSVTGSGTAGTVARCFYTANVRSAPGVGNALVGKVMVNSRIEIYEQQSYSGEMWGRTSIGWIAMQYVLTDGSLPVA